MSQYFRQDAEDLQRITGGNWNGPAGAHAGPDSARQCEVIGEYELVAAVLRAAIYDYQTFAGMHTRRAERSFHEIERWFWADDRHWHFSFINVCEILDLDPTYIRAGLKLWCERVHPRYPHHATQSRDRDHSPLATP